jgi:hypothetical protein
MIVAQQGSLAHRHAFEQRIVINVKPHRELAPDHFSRSFTRDDSGSGGNDPVALERTVQRFELALTKMRLSKLTQILRRRHGDGDRYDLVCIQGVAAPALREGLGHGGLTHPR